MHPDGTITWYLNRGSDLRAELLFRADDGSPADMTGHDLVIFEAEAWAAAHGTAAWVNQALGQAELRADWTAATPEETWLRVKTQRIVDGFDDALPRIVVRWL